MADQPDAADAADAAPSATTIALLPHALLARVLVRVPVDTRLRCAEVCRGWCALLATERSLWTALDLSLSSGVTHTGDVKEELLMRAAAAKAGNALQSLDVRGCYGISHDALLDVVTVNSRTLDELRTDGAWFDDNEGSDCERTEALLRAAAPQLQLFVTEVSCDAHDAPSVLVNDGVYTPLRLAHLHVSNGHWEGQPDDDTVLIFAEALAAYAWPLPSLTLQETPLGEEDVLDAVLDAARAKRVQSLSLVWLGDVGDRQPTDASVPALVRLLGGGALTSLYISGAGVLLPDAHAAALLGGALRAHTTFEKLELDGISLWRDCAAATTLIASLTAHPSLRELDLQGNAVGAAHMASAGAALAALVAANAPALQTLNVSGWQLGDVGLRPLFEALPRNTHLRVLITTRIGNDMSEALARDVLLPAVRANTSLTHLWVMYPM
jgi:hypothetical protein